jgi:hypothetical protein
MLSPLCAAVQQALDFLNNDALPPGFMWESYNAERDLDTSWDDDRLRDDSSESAQTLPPEASQLRRYVRDGA